MNAVITVLSEPSPMSLSTVCYRCETAYRDAGRVRCECGEPLWFDDDDRSAFDWNQCRDAQGVWRYGALLPVLPARGITPAAGDTPLVRSEALDDIAGCRVYVKDEGENPTGSYKDRGSAVAVPHALRQEQDTVGTVSYGNMAMSTAAVAASLGRECVVLVPADISAGRLELIAQYDPTMLRVDGEYSALYDEALALNETLPVTFLLSDAPGRISGYKTLLFELYERLAEESPDAIALPASSGGLASGLWRGILDLREAGLLETTPRLYLVQTAESDPITRAYRAAHDDVSALPPEDVGETIAHSIGNPDPPSGTRALTAARETDGAVVSVTDDAIRTAQRRLARPAGFCVEPASATPLAGVTQLADRGEIDGDESVVLVATGTGFKQMSVDDRSVQTEHVDRASLAERLQAIL